MGYTPYNNVFLSQLTKTLVVHLIILKPVTNALV